MNLGFLAWELLRWFRNRQNSRRSVSVPTSHSPVSLTGPMVPSQVQSRAMAGKLRESWECWGKPFLKLWAFMECKAVEERESWAVLLEALRTLPSTGHDCWRLDRSRNAWRQPGRPRGPLLHVLHRLWEAGAGQKERLTCNKPGVERGHPQRNEDLVGD